MMIKTYNITRVGNYRLVLERKRFWFSRKSKFKFRLLKLRYKFNNLFN